MSSNYRPSQSEMEEAQRLADQIRRKTAVQGIKQGISEILSVLFVFFCAFSVIYTLEQILVVYRR